MRFLVRFDIGGSGEATWLAIERRISNRRIGRHGKHVGEEKWCVVLVLFSWGYYMIRWTLDTLIRPSCGWGIQRENATGRTSYLGK